MATLITGRRLDANGAPVDGTGFAYEGGSRLAALIAQRCSPIYSQPITGEWVFGLVMARDSGGAFERGVGIFPAGNAGPPEHIHPAYEERFDILQGEFVFRIAGKEHPARAGQQLVVPSGTPHTFRCVGSGFGAMVVETRPAARTGEVIATLFGMAHEGGLTPSGRPKLLHAMVIAGEYADDTVFTSPPPALVIPLARLIAPLARAFGRRATNAKYLEEAFWQAQVEQP